VTQNNSSVSPVKSSACLKRVQPPLQTFREKTGDILANRSSGRVLPQRRTEVPPTKIQRSFHIIHVNNVANVGTVDLFSPNSLQIKGGFPRKSSQRQKTRPTLIPTLTLVVPRCTSKSKKSQKFEMEALNGHPENAPRRNLWVAIVNTCLRSTANRLICFDPIIRSG
jgi:hypothetical protein